MGIVPQQQGYFYDSPCISYILDLFKNNNKKAPCKFSSICIQKRYSGKWVVLLTGETLYAVSCQLILMRDLLYSIVNPSSRIDNRICEIYQTESSSMQPELKLYYLWREKRKKEIEGVTFLNIVKTQESLLRLYEGTFTCGSYYPWF